MIEYLAGKYKEDGFDRAASAMRNDSPLKSSVGGYVIYKRDFLYQNIESEYKLAKDAIELNKKIKALEEQKINGKGLWS